MKTVKETLDTLEGGWFTNNKKVSELMPRMVEDFHIWEKGKYAGKYGDIKILGLNITLRLTKVTDATAKKNGGGWKVSVY